MATFETYKIKSGDTLSAIAKRFNTSVESIVALNAIKDKNKIAVGQELRIRELAETVPPPPPSPKIVAPGPVAPAVTAPAKAPAPPSQPHVLGGLSKKYEVSKGGPGTVSLGKGDHGGVSYGSYQLSSKMNRPREFLAAEGAPWAGRFAGTVQGTPAFSKVWTDIAASEPDRFQAAQHDFIKRTHFDVQCATVKKATGVDLTSCSRAVQDVAWSVAVQHGPATALIVKAIGTLTLAPGAPGYDRALINAVYDRRGRRDANGALALFTKSSADFQKGVAARFVSERADALAMLAAEGG